MNAAIGPGTFRRLPASIAAQIEMSDLANLDVDLTPEAKARGLRFSQCQISFAGDKQSGQSCPQCSFTSSNVRVEMARVHFENAYFRDSQLWSGMGGISLLRTDFDTLVARITWGRDTFQECHGYSLVIDYHGWSGDMSRPTFDRCVIENLLFRWRDREMSDVIAFLESTISPTARIAKIYFVQEEGVGDSAKLVILRDPSAEATEWIESRNDEARGNE
jgi:hypothetical protein